MIAWLRKLFGADSPKMNKRRLDAAGTGRRNRWRGKNTGPNTDLRRLDLIRARCRDVSQNNRYGLGNVEGMVSNLVGDGAIPRCGTASPQLNQRVHALWTLWTAEADAAGMLDLYGLQVLAVRAWIESGEVFVRRRPRRMADGLAVPLQLEVLEADYVPWDKDEDNGDGRPRVVAGIEHSAIGRRTHYWMYRRHPQDQTVWAAADLVRVAADDVAHLYRATRPGQVRGIPWLAAVAMRLRGIDNYVDAEGERKQIESCVTAFVTHDEADPSDYLTGAEDGSEQEETPYAMDVYGETVERLAPGAIVHLMGGKTVQMAQPAIVSNYDSYLATELYGISSGTRVPYHIATGDLSKVNFSSARIGSLEFDRLVATLQNTIIVPLLLDIIWQWFIDAAVAAGALPAGQYPVSWAFPRKEAYEPAKQVASDIAEIRAGLTSYPAVIAKRTGQDWRELLAEVAEWNAAMDALKLSLDSDARKITKSGQVQSEAQQGEAA